MSNFEVEVEEVEYLKHEDKPLLVKLYKPKGSGPFPIMIELHGGAWAMGDRNNGDVANKALCAKHGVIVAALDFRTKDPYPNSMADIHYAVRWVKAKAANWNGIPERVGVMGTSSGAHQAMLLGMRPEDKRYSAVPSPAGLSTDGAPAAVIMVSPVIDPLGRYHYAQEKRPDGLKPPNGWATGPIIKSHDRYWVTEQNMDEGAPARILKRGEKTALPPTLLVRFQSEDAHPKPDVEEFVSLYKKAGGQMEETWFDGKGEPGWLYKNIDAPTSQQALDIMSAFITKHITNKQPAKAGSRL